MRAAGRQQRKSCFGIHWSAQMEKICQQLKVTLLSVQMHAIAWRSMSWSCLATSLHCHSMSVSIIVRAPPALSFTYPQQLP